MAESECLLLVLHTPKSAHGSAFQRTFSIGGTPEGVQSLILLDQQKNAKAQRHQGRATLNLAHPLASSRPGGKFKKTPLPNQLQLPGEHPGICRQAQQIDPGGLCACATGIPTGFIGAGRLLCLYQTGDPPAGQVVHLERNRACRAECVAYAQPDGERIGIGAKDGEANGWKGAPASGSCRCRRLRSCGSHAGNAGLAEGAVVVPGYLVIVREATGDGGAV